MNIRDSLSIGDKAAMRAAAFALEPNKKFHAKTDITEWLFDEQFGELAKLQPYVCDTRDCRKSLRFIRSLVIDDDDLSYRDIERVIDEVCFKWTDTHTHDDFYVEKAFLDVIM